MTIIRILFKVFFIFLLFFAIMILGDRMKNWKTQILEFLKEEYKFLLFLVLLYFILQIKVNYYIITGGGISDVSSRITVKEKYKSKGSFNISYVTELQKNTLLSYGLSYIIPNWERESADLYKYTSSESMEDIQFRSELELQAANSTATYWAYTLAGKEVECVSSHIYIVAVSTNKKTPFKVGDELKSMDEQSYEDMNQYKEYLQTKQEGDEIRIKVLRNQKEIELKAPLYALEDRLVLGINLQLIREYKTKPEVTISFKRTESGPSGGLITTLEIYNQLTEKDLTKGMSIAGTGTIEIDGTIGTIGGIRHKILGAVDAQADIFLVPSGNYEEALQYQKEKKFKMKLVEVKTIEDAIEQLEKMNFKKGK